MILREAMHSLQFHASANNTASISERKPSHRRTKAGDSDTHIGAMSSLSLAHTHNFGDIHSSKVFRTGGEEFRTSS